MKEPVVTCAMEAAVAMPPAAATTSRNLPVGRRPWSGTKPVWSLRKLVESGLIKLGEVLDVGCGEGRNSSYLAAQGFIVHAINIDEEELKIAKKAAAERGLSVDYRLADALDLPYESASMDLVLDYGCSQYQTTHQGQRKFEKEVARVLKPGGFLLYFGFNENHPQLGKATKVVFRSLQDLRQIYTDDFDIISYCEDRWPTTPQENVSFGEHVGYIVLMRKKE